MVTDADGQILYSNQANADIIEMSLDEAIGKNIVDFIPEDQKESGAAHFGRIMALGSHSGEIEIQSSSGKRIPIWAQASAVGGRKGEFRGAIIGTRDISKRKLGDEALRASEQNYREIFNTVNDAIFIHDIETGTILDVNNKMCEIYGLTPEEARKLSIGDISQGEEPYTQENAIKQMREVAEKGELVFKWHSRKKSGDLFWSEINLRRATIGGKDVVIAVERDISERMQAEEDIRRKNEELEIALKYNRELASIVAHELRGLLVPITGYADLLLDGSLGKMPEDAREALETIKSRARDLAKLVDDLRLLSSMARGDFKLDLQALSMAHTIREIISIHEQVDYGKPVGIRWDGEDFSIRADLTRIHQVIRNIIDNAVKYSGDSAEIHIITSAEDGKGNIRIMDRGVGISESDLPKIFDRFYRVEDNGSRSESGTGLGLSIARELTESMGGTITVESEPGKGSTFTVSMPSV